VGTECGNRARSQPESEASLLAKVWYSAQLVARNSSTVLVSKEHLRFVAQRPCLIYGSPSSHAHHVRFAQSRGLGLKVSDEFTVLLCAIHHQQNHATGNERLWWQEHKVDPLPVAERLWRKSQQV
jgi:hypothetical protein